MHIAVYISYTHARARAQRNSKLQWFRLLRPRIVFHVHKYIHGEIFMYKHFRYLIKTPDTIKTRFFFLLYFVSLQYCLDQRKKKPQEPWTVDRAQLLILLCIYYVNNNFFTTICTQMYNVSERLFYALKNVFFFFF